MLFKIYDGSCLYFGLKEEENKYEGFEIYRLAHAECVLEFYCSNLKIQFLAIWKALRDGFVYRNSTF